jgi:tetratricopeptide (TPR) repeat protein
MERAYLVRHLFDGQRLRERALEEFTMAVRTGRLIAFVGSYATQDMKYPTWSKFLSDLSVKAVALCNEHGAPGRRENARHAIEAIANSLDTSDAALTGLSVIEYALGYADAADGVLIGKLQEEAAKIFALRKIDRDKRSNVRRLLEDLAIERVITLNYDMEFEWELMTTIAEKSNISDGGNGRQSDFDKLLNSPQVMREPRGTISRILPNGKGVVSDLFTRERTDRLIDFAVGSPDYEAHILHLHGRRDRAESMVISQRDYNNQYRRSGVAKLPFEHALRILFAGNPILFVGIGLKESEVTATLEQFISDHPNRRISPVFILWNKPKKAFERDAMRFRWLHRFGALTLFDDEIEPRHIEPKGDAQTRLANAIENLAFAAAQRAETSEWKQDDLRQIGDKLAKLVDEPQVDIWSTDSEAKIVPREAAVAWADSGKPLALFVGAPGCGKGQLAKELQTAWHQQAGTAERRSCLINASFVFELDSVFSLISGLADGKPAAKEKSSRLASLQRFLGSNTYAELLIVINGMERFLSPAGAPLSSELDSLIRLSVGHTLAHLIAEQDKAKSQTPNANEARANGTDAQPGSIATTEENSASAATTNPTTTPRHKVTIAVLGTDRVRRYFGALTEFISHDIMRPQHPQGIASYLPSPSPGKDHFFDDQGASPRRYMSTYFELVARRFGDARCDEKTLPRGAVARIREKALEDPTGLRRAFLAAYLQPEALKDAGASNPDLCLDIMTTMAIIGQPVECAVLGHCPRVRNRLASLGDATGHRFHLNTALDELKNLGLIIKTSLFPGSPAGWRRFGLHRSVLTQIRDRLSVPLTDAQLSAGFNLSSFVALPADGYSPEHEIHEELGVLVDWLGGAYKDLPLSGVKELELEGGETAPSRATKDAIRRVMLDRDTPRHPRAWPHTAACLRAALAILRSYYSTSTLLMVDPSSDVPKLDEDGPLTQHADRIDRLISAAKRTAVERSAARAELGPKAEWLGPAPFYADDLVWLYNERGVVKLTQGDLYEARFSFNEASRLNRGHVEFGDHLHNWRRIMLNQVHLDIERAWLDRAEKRMTEIEDSIELITAQPIADVRTEIVGRYTGVAAEHRCWVDPAYERDFVVCMALVMGYRGLIAHLQGQLDIARTLLERAVIILDNLGEVRAHAIFMRHLSALLAALGESSGVEEALRKALVAGEATKQADTAHHGRVVSAARRVARTDPAGRAALTRQLRTSLNYAEAGDMHRLRVEAGLNLARVKFDSGDFDVALEYAADALATASRYGLNLRKISLRILIGQILIARGDPISGRALIEKAIKNAERVGYHTAIELAQRVIASQNWSPRDGGRDRR